MNRNRHPLDAYHRAYRGEPGPGRGNQDFGPHGALPYGSRPPAEPGADWGEYAEREYEARHYPERIESEDPDPRRNMHYADPPDQGWGRSGAQARQHDPRRAREFGRHRGVGPKNWRRADERLLDDIGQRLADDPWIDASDIELTCSEGTVTLTGSVPDRRMKLRAEGLVDQCSGVNDIENRITVKRQGSGGNEAQAMSDEDDQGLHHR